MNIHNYWHNLLWKKFESEILNYKHGLTDFKLSFFEMHSLNIYQQDKIIKNKKLIIIDYCLAERNLNLPIFFVTNLIENCSFHNNTYKKFMDQGAIEGLIHKFKLTVLERKIFSFAQIIITT